MKENFKSGFVAIIGRPNVGKSTLMNHLIGQKIAITSKKPQTTRNKIQTVYTCEDGQIIFLDTPGIHKAKNKLGEYMVNVAEQTLKDVDVILWLVEPTTYIGAGEKHIAEQLQKTSLPVILVINKVDTVKKEDILQVIDNYRKLYDFAEIIPASALRGQNTKDIVNSLFKYMPYGQHIVDIEATIICERDSHKGIIIGKQGSMLKKIGSNARFEIEKMLEERVNLKIWVKVKKDWRDSDTLMKNFGYNKKEI